ncbi:hypothetical protein EVAR_83293_1 [Eumeta japonica]|uniref:Reverse transcriptase domain-containing protein n=1 Tax=Eumeta variegata TaxID=151549 RepID=A0A4C1XB04_EUMVA|nr:hypothetical protein EVAR_83293_1 [Eumeta japonica]
MWGRGYNRMCDRLRNRKRYKDEGIHYTSMPAQLRALVVRARTAATRRKRRRARGERVRGRVPACDIRNNVSGRADNGHHRLGYGQRRRKAWAVWATAHGLAMQRASRLTAKTRHRLISTNIWEALKEQGIEQKYIRLIRNVQNQLGVHSARKDRDSFEVKRSKTRRSSLRSFLCCFRNGLPKARMGKSGLNIDGSTLTHLRFADDYCVIRKTPEDLNIMLNDLASESAKVGLQLNPEKLK